MHEVRGNPAGAAARTPASLPYMPQLDGLRGIAVLAVLFSHWVPQANRFGHVGLAGVYVFFVLSGFLITSILLDVRDAREGGRTTLRSALRAFFGRRILRIFPAYYFALIASFFAWPKMFAADLPWNLAYLGNMRAVSLGKTTSINHFWSLAVEEQFYLFWPFLVLLLPRRHLVRVVSLAVAASVLWRCAAVSLGWRHIVYSYPVWSNLDSLGLGALLAIGSRGAAGDAAAEEVRGEWIRSTGALGALLWAACGIATFASLGSFRLSRPGPVYAAIFIVYPFAVSLTSVYLVARAARASAVGYDLVGELLGSRALRALGVVSYGVYVYHFFVQGIVDLVSIHFIGRELATGPRLLVLFVATIGVATLSWFVLERPARSLSRRLGPSSPRRPLTPAR